MEGKNSKIFAAVISHNRQRKVWQKLMTLAAALVVFCTTYALILPAITMETKIVCGKEEHAHTETCFYIEETNPKEKILVCEKEEHVHEELCYATDYENEFYYENELLEVVVKIPEGSQVSADAVLRVTPVLETDDEYVELIGQADAALQGQTEKITLYDISFYTDNAQYIEVSDEAEVTIRFKEQANLDAENLAVLHYEEEQSKPVELEQVAIETDEANELVSLTFQTEGFSVFALVEITGVGGNVSRVPVTSNMTLAGQEYVITSVNGSYMLDVTEYSDTRLNSPAFFARQEISEMVFWGFESQDGGYLVKTTVDDTVYYLNLTGTSLTKVADAENATAFTMEVIDGYLLLKNGGYYLNLFGGETEHKGFAGWNTNDAGSRLRLYQPSEDTLDGMSGAIVDKVNDFTGYALLAEADGTRLKRAAVNILDSDHIKGDNITVWTFTAADSSNGTYYVSAVVDGTEKYLNISGQSVSVSDTKQEITIELVNEALNLSNSGYALDHYRDQGCFGSWSNSYSSNQLMNIYSEVTESVGLIYVLNLHDSYAVSENGWRTDGYPYLTDVLQQITDMDQIYTVQGERNENGYFWNCAHYDADAENGSISHVNAYLDSVGADYGKEYRFDGWNATDVDGVSHLIPEGADIKNVGDSTYLVTWQENGTEKTATLAKETTLTGKWSQISDTVLFFVNYTGTVLDTEGNVSGRNQKDFTPCVGIGRVYNGTLQVGSDDVFALEANEEITSLLVNEYNPDNPATQIVMQYITTTDGNTVNYYEAAPGINDSLLANSVLNYIKNKPETIKISSDSGNNPTIDPANADGDHYKVRWYVLKDQNDAWHIDGVLVAVTEDVEIIKTISGLDEEQADTVMEQLKVDVALGPNEESYIQMDTEDLDGVYEYHGRTLEGMNSFSWTFNAVQDEQYRMEELNYQLPGYDCSTVVVVRTTDGEYYAEYGATSTEARKQYMIGGLVESVSFNNFYTETGTGMFNIVKRDSSIDLNNPAGKLEGAEFTLTNADGTVNLVETTNENGAITFSNLEPGTYTLTETGRPDGFLESDEGPWTVEVVDENNELTVTLIDKNNKETLLYQYDTDSQTGTLQAVYVIENTPNNSTITITKQFKDLLTSELAAMKTGDTPYTIELVHSDDSKIQYELLLDGTGDDDTLIGSPSTDGFTYTWRLTDAKPGIYQVTEKNYHSVSVKDTIVDASVKDVLINYETEEALFEVELSESESKLIRITNHYTDVYTAKVKKTDAEGDLLEGAEFAVYGSFAEAKDTSRTIRYVDPVTNQTKTAFYIGSMMEESAGLYSWAGLKLSAGTEKYTYVIKEETAPEGYALLKEPIVIYNVGPENVIKTGLEGIVTSGADAAGSYYNGVFTVEVVNQKKEDAVVDVTVEKVWAVTQGGSVSFQLYRKTAAGDIAEAVGNPITLDGAEDTAETSAWIASWKDVAAYDAGGEEYIYYVAEVQLDGFKAEYSEDSVGLKTGDSDDLVIAGNTKWNEQTLAYEVTITNRSSYELPDSGGLGTNLHITAGVLIMGLTLMIYMIQKRDERKGNGR